MKKVLLSIGFVFLCLAVIGSITGGNIQKDRWHALDDDTTAPPATPPPDTAVADAQAAVDAAYNSCATQIHNEFFRGQDIYDYDWDAGGMDTRYVMIDVHGLNRFGVKVTNRFRCPR